MLSVEDCKPESRIFKLLVRFSEDYTNTVLIPETEANCRRYRLSPALVERFRAVQLAENCRYFAYDYAYADIPAGQSYAYMACLSREGKILPESVVECRSVILCFFSIYRFRPLESACHGHHEICAVQFPDGIPTITARLDEFSASSKSLAYHQRIGLFSLETLHANLPDWERTGRRV